MSISVCLPLLFLLLLLRCLFQQIVALLVYLLVYLQILKANKPFRTMFGTHIPHKHTPEVRCILKTIIFALFLFSWRLVLLALMADRASQHQAYPQSSAPSTFLHSQPTERQFIFFFSLFIVSWRAFHRLGETFSAGGEEKFGEHPAAGGRASKPISCSWIHWRVKCWLQQVYGGLADKSKSMSPAKQVFGFQGVIWIHFVDNNQKPWVASAGTASETQRWQSETRTNASTWSTAR